MGNFWFGVLMALVEEHVFELDVLCQKLLIKFEGFFQIIIFGHCTDRAFGRAFL